MKKILLIILLVLGLSLPAYASSFDEFLETAAPGGGSGVLTNSNCNQSQYFAIGTLCQDTDDGKLYKGTGSGILEVAAGASTGNVVGPGTTTRYKIPYWDSTQLTLVDGLAPVSGKIILGNATPAWAVSGYTVPAAVCTTGYGLISDGTNFICTTSAFGTAAYATIANYLPLAGGTMTGQLVGVTPTSGGSGYASINLPHGTAPTTNLANGDCWTTTAGLYCRINGSTVGPYISGTLANYLPLAGGTMTGNLVTKASAAVAGAGFNLPSGVVPNSPAAGDLYYDGTHLYFYSASAAHDLLAAGGSGADANGYYVVTRATNAPTNAVNLGALTTGLLKMSVSGSVATLSTASAGSDYQAALTNPITLYSTYTAGHVATFYGTNQIQDGGTLVTYTEPASNLPLCRTGSGTTGACTNLTDVAFSGYAAKAGGNTFTGGKQTLAATASGYASINLPSGTAPSSPAAGDLYYDGTHLYFYSGSAHDLLTAGSGVNAGGTTNDVQLYGASTLGVDTGVFTYNTSTHALAVGVGGMTAAKTASTAGTMLLYDDYSTEAIGAGWQGPHATSTMTNSYYLALPLAEPTVNQIMTFAAPSSHVATGSWVTPALSSTGAQVTFATGGSTARTITVPDAAVTMATTTGSNWAPATTVSSGAIGALTGNTNYIICTNTCSFTPPTPAAGIRVCARNAPNSTGAITLNALGSNLYYEKSDHSNWNTANKNLASGGAQTDSICIFGYDATHYLIVDKVGTWTDGS